MLGFAGKGQHSHDSANAASEAYRAVDTQQMFKKTTVTQAARPLNGKDVKVLRANLQAAFPNLQIDQVTAYRPNSHWPPRPTDGHSPNAGELEPLLPPDTETRVALCSWTSSCRRKRR